MYVTLLTDVKGLGKKTERVRVSDAYARNVLIPQKQAFVGEQSAFSQQFSSTKKKLPTTEDIKKSLRKPLIISKEANESGGLYEKFSEKECVRDIAHLLSVSESQIHLTSFSPIKSTGEHPVAFTLANTSYTLQVTIKSK